jgi:hypothetical protein
VSALQGQVGEVRMTLEITRAATGLTETVELVGAVTLDEPEPEEDADGRHP